MGDSNSIKNQKKILLEYANKNGFKNPKVFIDDGYSGTNFDRPAFIQLMSLVKEHKVSTLIVKDMSRFGRDYIQVGMYTEILLPKENVRFIAINDNVDSLKGDDDFTPFRNIINEWYAKDTSKKIKAVFTNKGNNGFHTGSHPVYGYLKNNDGEWYIDEEAAIIVRKIYALCLEGYGPYEIAHILEEEKVMCPSAHLASYNQGTKSLGAISNKYKWNGPTVINILSRKEYLGYTINFKTKRKSFRDKKRYKVCEEEMKAFENKHDPVIDLQTFERVQKMRLSKRQSHQDNIPFSKFTGLLYCSDCSKKLYPFYDKKNKNSLGYLCSTYKKDTSECSTHYIRDAVLEKLVLETLKQLIIKHHIHKEDYISLRESTLASSNTDSSKSNERSLHKVESRLTELDFLIQKCYEDYVKDVISKERYDSFIQAYEKEYQELTDKKKQLTTLLNSLTKKKQIDKSMQDIIKTRVTFKILTTYNLNQIIHHIDIGKRTKDSSHTTQYVDIYLNFKGN